MWIIHLGGRRVKGGGGGRRLAEEVLDEPVVIAVISARAACAYLTPNCCPSQTIALSNWS